MPIVNRTDAQGLLLGIYGIPGSGKTVLAAALAQLLFEMTGKKSLFADWEMGSTSVPRSVPIDVWQPTGADPLDEAQEILELGKRGDYAAVINDTVSTMCERFLRSVVDTPGGGGNKITTKGGRVMKAAGLQDYGAAQMAFQQWALGCHGLLTQGKHVLWTAHERLVEVKQADLVVGTYGGPELVGSQLTLNTPKLVQVLLRIVTRKVGTGVERFLMVESDGLYIAKDRFHCLPQAGVKIGVKMEQRDEKGEVKKKLSGEEFEQEVLAIGMKVWRTVLTAQAKQREEKSAKEGSPTASQAQERPGPSAA